MSSKKNSWVCWDGKSMIKHISPNGQTEQLNLRMMFNGRKEKNHLKSPRSIPLAMKIGQMVENYNHKN